MPSFLPERRTPIPCRVYSALYILRPTGLFPLRSLRPRLVPMAVKRRDILVPPHRRQIELVHIVKRYRAHGAALRRPADAVAFHSFFLSASIHHVVV